MTMKQGDNTTNDVENGRVTPSWTKEEPADFETAVEQAGVGLFSYSVLLTAGVIFLTSGLQNGVNAYILPAAKCDFDLTSAQMGVLNAVFLAGGVTSSYLWGVLGDALGRRPVILFALLADAICTLLSTLSQSYAVFAVFRFVSGACIGGPSSIVFLYLGEFVSMRVRATYTLIVGVFWTVSWIMLPGLAWLVLPQHWETVVLGLTLNSWRVFLALITVPTLLAAFLVARLPETPQFLISQGRLDCALDVLSRMYAINTGLGNDQYPVKALARPTALGHPSSGLSDVANLKSVLRVAKRMCADALSLFHAPILRRTSLMCSIFFANMFSYYGLVLWLPELFNRFEVHYHLHPNQTMTVCQLSRAWGSELLEIQAEKDTAALELGGSPGSSKCSAAEAVNETVFLETLIISGVCLVANVLCALVASRVGRRTLPFLLNVVSGVLAAAIYFVDSTTGNLVVSSLFQAMIGTGNVAINGLAVDIFPTRVSALGVCSAVLSGRLGAAVSNLVLGALLDVSCEVPIFLIAATVIVGGVLCAFVPPPCNESNAHVCAPEEGAVSCKCVDDDLAEAVPRKGSVLTSFTPQE